MSRPQTLFIPLQAKPGESYSPIKGKSFHRLQQELIAVYNEYEEYHEGSFLKMVELFASDPFYHLHKVAQEYIRLDLASFYK